jgi:hypothetical protein
VLALTGPHFARRPVVATAPTYNFLFRVVILARTSSLSPPPPQSTAADKEPTLSLPLQ